MKKYSLKKTAFAALLLVCLLCSACSGMGETYSDTVYPLERNGVQLHLDCMTCPKTREGKNILLVHGLTYSSPEFDVDYKDYSLSRYFARNGYAVWRLDITGYGQSGLPENGFVPDSRYAAEDINAAVDRILEVTGEETIDLLGWSWGTVTSSLFAAENPQKLHRLILYAPILSGLGEEEVTEDYHANSWENAASDFQMTADGVYDLSITEQEVIDIYCSNCWRYDGDSSPNGGRRDLMTDPSEQLIDLSAISIPTLVICGDADPYLDYDAIASALEYLPAGSQQKIITGASHAAMMEKPYYKEFRRSVLMFLR